MKNKIKIAILYSGKGSNIRPILDMLVTIRDKAECVVFVSNRYKKEYPYKTNYITKEEYLLEALKFRYDVDLILLCGYDTILSPTFVKEYKNRILNIHPSILPHYPGANALQRVLDDCNRWFCDSKDKVGTTVHIVDEGVDTGRILRQRNVDVFPTDTLEELRARVLEVENRIYPGTIKAFIESIIDES